MVRHSIALLAAAALLACAPPSGSLFDDDDTPADDDDDTPSELEFALPVNSHVGDEVQGSVRVPGYGGEVSFFHVGGDLPDGMRLTANGVFLGTFEALGSYTFTVQATEMSIPDILAERTIEVVLRDAPLHIGVVHNRTTTLTADFGLQYDPWMRIQAEGEPDLTRVVLEVGRYHPGLNGENDAGWGDDVFIEAVDITACTLTLSEWILPDGTDCHPQDRPPHCNEDDPMTHLGDGVFETGADTGHYEVGVDCGDLGATSVRVMALPPAWCPLGEHYGGPPWQQPGACEPE